MEHTAPEEDAHTEEKRQEVSRLKRVFGLSYIWQGSSDLTETPLTYFIKESLKLTDAWGQIFSGATTIGWLIKPLWGWVSDRFPIGGRHRKPWFIIMALLAVFTWAAAAFGAWTGNTAPLYFFLIFNAGSAAAAFVDVVGDALMVEHGQRLNMVGKFVNHQWTMYALSSAAAGFVGGWLTTHIEAGDIGYETAFLAASILPLIVAFVAWRTVSEEPKKEAKIDTGARKTISQKASSLCCAIHACCSLENIKVFVKKHRLLMALFFFIFFWNFNPSFGYIEKSYLIDKRGFTPDIFGMLAVVNGCVFLASVVCYRLVTRWVTRITWEHWLYAMIVLSIITLPSSVFMYLEPGHPWWKLVDRLIPDWLGTWEYIPDWNRYVWFRLITGSLISFAAIPAFMIPLQIAGKGINVAVAGLQYALLMSISNFSHTVDNMLGGALYGLLFGDERSVGMHPLLQQFSHSVFEIAGSVDKRTLILELFIWVGVLFTLLSIPFVMWVKRVFRDNNINIVLHEKT